MNEDHTAGPAVTNIICQLCGQQGHTAQAHQPQPMSQQTPGQPAQTTKSRAEALGQIGTSLVTIGCMIPIVMIGIFLLVAFLNM